jgi:hypothetical protein
MPIMTIPNHSDLDRLTQRQLKQEIILLREMHGAQAARYQNALKRLRGDMKLLASQLKKEANS